MRELLRSNNPVLLSYVQALLGAEAIEHLVLDGYMSVLEGSVGVLPRRVLVADEDLAGARALLVEAGIAAELTHDR